MSKVLIVTLAAVGLLSACSSASQRGEPERYDLGLPAGTLLLPGVAAIDVSAPSWLAGEGIEYRLAFAGPASRRAYLDSRWAAPPAEMLRLRLQQQSSGVGRCRLRVELDELLQVFDAPESARQHLVVRVSLQPGTGAAERSRFAIDEATASADARGAVAATRRLVDRLGEQLATWLAARSQTCAAATDPAR